MLSRIMGARRTGALALGLFLGGHLNGVEWVRDAQNALSEWIEVEKRISADRSEWAVEKEVLQDSIEFMKTELERLEEIIATAQETASAGERKRAELEELKAKHDAVTDAMRESVEAYENRIKEMAETWPKAFLSEIATPLKRIPSAETAVDVPLTLRLQNIVVILTQFDKFNSMISKETEIQDVDGVSREVTTLYYGFAYAYFVDGNGEYAGYGYPREEGWEWVADASLAPKVSDLLTVYDRTKEAVFIGLPASIATP